MNITLKKEFQDLIFPLTPEEYNLLEQSILKEGVRDPLVIWRNGKDYLIDGHHRYQIIQKHGITKYSTKVLHFESKNEVINWILDNQLGRRNCTPEATSYLRGLRYKNEKLPPFRPKKDEKISPLKTSERLAEQYHVTERTIYNDEIFTDAIDSIVNSYSSPNKRKEIKHQILTRQTSLTKKELLELSELSPSLIKSVIEDKNELWEARAAHNKNNKAQKLQRATNLALPKDIQFFVGDCVELANKHIEDDSIQCIITDPPYAKASLSCFENLGKIAQRVLKPSGYCCFYSGKMNLDKVFEIMGTKLSYYWQIILLHHGKIGTDFNPITVHARKVNTFYKSILVFQKPPLKRTEEYFNDIINGSGIEKSNHPWQQSEKELYSVVDKFSKIGTTVLDPFCGSGTTGVVCNSLGRKFIGFDLNAECVKESKIRIRNVVNAGKDSEKKNK